MNDPGGIAKQNHTLRAVLDSLDAAVVGCDDRGRAVLTNRSARLLFGLSDDAGPVEHWDKRFSGFRFSDVRGDMIAAADMPVPRLLRGEPVRDMIIVVHIDETADRTFRVHGTPVTGDDQLAAVIAVHEVTRERRAQTLKECEQEVSFLLAKPEPADDVIADTIELIGRRLGWAAVDFWSLDQVGDVLRRKGCWATDRNTLPCELPDLLEQGVGIPGMAWDRGDPVWCTDLDSDPDAQRQATSWLPLRAALAVPIPSGALVLGVLVCYSVNHETPDDMRTAVMTGISAHIGEFLERRRAEQFAAELEATRDEYIALVGHELRTPLTSIQANADLLREEPGMPA
ncbi:GAF domain-containing protein [Actinoplanes couchii]|uniref:histidine kinase n=1 Tax=Actinoplanes couchii TaxID=403638 RepID=A0ABQ3XEA4_9ACTN|nr:GAF domain-containing protein [Actinoplanes couchii]GID56745.1 hypothetical protein Aco03nite_051490 [Actinoplanes couchii]